MNAQPYQVYLVGGAVRDTLLKLPVIESDWVVVGARPEQLLEQGYRRVGQDFPVFHHPQSREEYALARTERKVAPGYYGFETNFDPRVTLEEDLSRRDLTINAIAQAADGSLIDPFGGVADLNQRILRHVSPAFVEDPVRLLRIARFAARFHFLKFKIAPETLELMRTMVRQGELEALVPERVWKELERALRLPDARVFIEVLQSVGAWASLWPDLAKLWGVPQPIEEHPEVDTGLHTLMVLAEAKKLTSSSRVAFAALCHDLGKGQTPPEQWPDHSGYEQRGAPLVHNFCDRYRVPKDFRVLSMLVALEHRNCHQALELEASACVDLLVRLKAYQQKHMFEDFLHACEADARGRLGYEARDYPQADYMRQAKQATQVVDTHALLAQGFKGSAMAQAVREARVAKLKA